MDIKSITRTVYDAPNDKFTVLPIKQSRIVGKTLDDSRESEDLISKALLEYFGFIFNTNITKKIRHYKTRVIWGKDNKIDPYIDSIQIFRYGRQLIVFTLVLDRR